MRKTLLVLVILLMTEAMLFATGSQQTGPAGAATKLTVEVFDRGSDGGRTPADNNM